MNKLFTKIAAVFLGVTMAVGVGVAVGTSAKAAKQVSAAATDGTAQLLFDDDSGGWASSTTESKAGPIGWVNSANNSYSKPTRIYSGNTFTIRITDTDVASSINGVVIGANSNAYATSTASSTWNVNGTSTSVSAAASGSTVTATTTGTVTQITVTASAQIRWNSVTVYYTEAGGGGGGSDGYQHIFSAKPSTGDNINLSGINWNITATNLNGYQAGYAGVQFGSSKADGSIGLTSSNSWGHQTGSDFEDKVVITKIRVWFNRGGTSVTPSVTIGGVAAISDGTTIAKNSSCGGNYKDATRVTFTPATNGDKGVVVISASSVNAGYICCIEIDCEEEQSIPVTSIEVTPVTSTIAQGEYVDLTATVEPDDATDPSVTWSVSPENQGVTVSSSGRVSASGNATTGDYTITASANDGSGESDSATVTVTENQTHYVTVDPTFSGYTGQTLPLTFVYGNFAGSLGITSNNGNITVGTIDDEGEGNESSVSITFNTNGTSVLTFKDGNDSVATVAVTINQSTVSALTLNKTTIYLAPQETVTLTAEATYVGSLPTVNWSSNSEHATVPSEPTSTQDAGEGKATASITVTGVSVGSATITATCSGQSANSTVNVSYSLVAYFGTTNSASSTAVATDEGMKGVEGYSINEHITFSNLKYAYPSANCNVKMGSGSNGGVMELTIDSHIGEDDVYITTVVVYAKKYGSDSTTINIGGVSKTLTASTAAYTVDLTGEEQTTVSISATGGSQRYYIEQIVINYEVVKEFDPTTYTSLEIKHAANTTTFDYGDEFTSSGLTVNAIDSYGTPKTYEDTFTLSIAEGTVLTEVSASITVTISLTIGEITKSTSYTITVNAVHVTGIALSGTGISGSGTSYTLDLDRSSSVDVSVALTPETTSDVRTTSIEKTSGSNITYVAIEGGYRFTSTNATGTTSFTIKSTAQPTVSATLDITVSRPTEYITIDETIIVDKYEKTTSISVGDKILFVYEDGKTELSGISTIGDVEAYDSEPEALYPLEVVAGKTGYAFKTPGNTYVSWSSGNSLTTSESVAPASSWTISESADGNFKFANVGTSTRLLQYNSGSPRFACYTTNQKPFQIYKHVNEERQLQIEISDDLYGTVLGAEENISCNASGTGSTYDWSEVKDYFDTFKEIGEDGEYVTTKLAKAFANKNGNPVEQFLAKYDYMVTKYHYEDQESYCEDFLGRIEGMNLTLNGSKISVIQIVNNTESIAIIAVISLISVSAIGGYFFLRKRREEN